MRPHLHPDMGEVVICARVARQLSAIAWRYNHSEYQTMRNPATTALELIPSDYPGMLRFALHSLSVYLELDYTSSQWLHNVLDAARWGHSFRRCFFFDYKENRRAYPRVTNRGVGADRGPTTFGSREAKGNA